MNTIVCWDGAIPIRASEARTRADTPAAEAELIERARTDRDAFAALYRAHYAAIGSYLRRRTGDVHATEDLLSEVFLAALAGIGRYRSRGVPFRFWLYRIATNAANRWARDRRYASRAIAPAAQAAALPESSDEREQEHARARQALLALAPKLQAVATLFYLEELGVAEIAQVLRCRPGTVKSRLKRARDALRQVLQPRR